MRNRTSNLRTPRSDVIPLSQTDSTVSEVYYEVHIIRVLDTARIGNVDSVMFVNRIRQIVSFQLGKGFFSLSHAGDKTKNIFN